MWSLIDLEKKYDIKSYKGQYLEITDLNLKFWLDRITWTTLNFLGVTLIFYSCREFLSFRHYLEVEFQDVCNFQMFPCILCTIIQIEKDTKSVHWKLVNSDKDIEVLICTHPSNFLWIWKMRPKRIYKINLY